MGKEVGDGVELTGEWWVAGQGCVFYFYLIFVFFYFVVLVK